MSEKKDSIGYALLLLFAIGVLSGVVIGFGAAPYSKTRIIQMTTTPEGHPFNFTKYKDELSDLEIAVDHWHTIQADDYTLYFKVKEKNPFSSEETITLYWTYSEVKFN